MSYFEILCKWPEHPKVEALLSLGDDRYCASVALWFRLVEYCSIQRNTGEFGKCKALEVSGIPEQAQALSDLESVGLAHATDSGFILTERGTLWRLVE